MSDRVNLDLDREGRLGFPEAIFGENKDIKSLIEIIEIGRKHEKHILITHLQKEKFEHLNSRYEGLFYRCRSWRY